MVLNFIALMKKLRVHLTFYLFKIGNAGSGPTTYVFFISGSGADIFVFLGNTTYIMESDICHNVVISGGNLVQ